MGNGFTSSVGEDGKYYTYQQGDASSPPSAFMTLTGLYFEPIVRQEDLDAKKVWNGAEDFKDQYSELSDEDLRDLESQATDLYNNTQYAIFANDWDAGIGDALFLPGAALKHPKGVRDFEEWLASMLIRPEYIHEIFEMQTEISMINLKKYYEAVGEKVNIIAITGTDFGAQSNLLVSVDVYRELFKPYHKRMTDWIHANTG